MKISKKMLSLVLCMAMLISTMAVGLGLSASADGSLTYGKETVSLAKGVNDLTHSSEAGYEDEIPTYEELCLATGGSETATNSFVYYGARYYTLGADSSTKNYIDKSKVGKLEKGTDLYIEVYYMTNYTYNCKITDVAFAFDGNFFDFETIDSSATASTGFDFGDVKAFFTNNFIGTDYVYTVGSSSSPVFADNKFSSETEYSPNGKNKISDYYYAPYIAYVGSSYPYFHLTDAATGDGIKDNGDGLPSYVADHYDIEDVKDWRVVCFPLKRVSALKNTNTWTTDKMKTGEPLTTFKVTVKENPTEGKGSIVFPSYYFNIANEATDGVYSNGIFLNRISETNKSHVSKPADAIESGGQVKPTYFINDCNCDFSLPPIEVTFVDGAQTFKASINGGAAITQENAATGTIPTEKNIENLYGWEDKNHNIIDLANTTVTEEMTLYAVKKSQKVNVTLSLKNSQGEVYYECTNLPDALKTKYNAVYSADNHTITMTVPITGLTSEELNSITLSGGSFLGWVNSELEEFNGTFNSTESNQTFIVKSGIPVKYLPIGNTVEFKDESIGPGYEEQEWSTLFYYDVSYGSKLTNKDLIAIQKEINKNYDALNAGTGAAAYGTDIQICIKNEVTDEETAKDSSKIEVSKKLSESEPQYAAFSVGTTYNDTVTQDTIGNYVFGKTADVIYINTAVQYDYEIKIPTIDDEGNVQYKESQTKSVYYLAIGQKDAGYKKASQYTAFIWNESLSKVEVTSINNESKAIATFTAPTVTYDTNIYHLAYTDEKGNSLSNVSAGKNIIEFSRVKDENGNAIKNCASYVCYITPQKTVYHIGIKVDGNIYATGKPYYYGDEIDLSAFSELATQKIVHRKYAEGKDELYEENKIALTDLYNDGAAVGKAGYSLTAITYNTGSGTIDFKNDDDPKLVIDEALVKTATVEDNYPNKYISFDAEWVGSDYTFNIYYQNANSEWVHAITKTFSTGDDITYDALIGSGSTLDQKIKDDHPYGSVPGTSLTKEPGGSAWDNIKAQDAANENNSIDLYIKYTVDGRYVMVDYNNAYDENGEPNKDKEPGISKKLDYGTVIYDPSYTADSGTERPFANEYLIDEGFKISSVPDQKQETDEKGNKKYNPVYVDVVDEEGNPVYEGDTIKQEPKTDEDGNIVYDYSSPIMSDSKSKEEARPYRNCEFNGFKVYYVDGVYSSIADLPDKSEWKEGFNDQNETGAQHLYTTVILQVQWIADSDFLFRVYDDQGNISFAMGKDYSRHYWNVNGYPCNKGENVLVEDPETYYCIFLKLVKEEGNGYYLKAKTIERMRLNMVQPTTFLFGTLWPLIKKLLLG